jgi:NADH-quinone oxidoreductase subunit N
MFLHQQINQLLHHELPRSLEIFAPEMMLCVAVLLLLLGRMLGWQRRVPMHGIALLGALLVFLGVFAQFLFLRGGTASGVPALLTNLWQLTHAGAGTPGVYLSGLLIHDQFAVLLRLGLSLFLVLMVVLTMLSGIPDHDDAQDFYALMFGATLGMMLAVGVSHLLMFFLAVEMMSVPSYVLVGFQKGRRKAGEAALKYVMYGAAAAGVMLYGISLVAGLLGTFELPLLAQRVTQVLPQAGLSQSSAVSMTLLLGLLLILAGLCFKLALVPFHFWCPDAFEGASAEVAAFLSIASKVASFALLVRLAIAFAGTSTALHQLCLILGLLLGVIAIVSATYGNLAAYLQTNLKRLLAYSTIAQAGYMVMAVSAMLVLLSTQSGTVPYPAQAATRCVEGLIYYLAVYLFMNLAAFACVALLRNEIFSEEIDAYRGLFAGNSTVKCLCLCLTGSFFSLVGIPPMGGAFAKLLVFISVYQAGSVHWFLWVVLVAGVVNSVISLFYYMRVLKAIFLSDRIEGAPKLRMSPLLGGFVAIITVPIVALGARPLMADLSETAQRAAWTLFS